MKTARLYFAPVERHVKERLIGAAVLVAAAVILIPEMLSGPERTAQTAADAPAAPGSLKTYTIDLSRPGSGSTAANVSEEAPPRETMPVEESTSTLNKTVPESGSSTVPSGAETPTQSPPDGTADAPARTVHPAEQPTAHPEVTAAPKPAQPVSKPSSAEHQTTVPDKKPASPPARPATGQWAVQVGSFANQATAAKLAKDLQGDGFDSFVMPVKSGASTLYRVRIGPMNDRDAATRLLSRIKARSPTAAVVKHP
ncbi:MAG: SPOR domain-containing protein [Povalibacter sp.]